jgi:hypothetical protein
VAVRHGRDQARAERAAAVAPGQVGGGAGLVEEDEARRVHEALPDAPPPALAGDVGAVLLGRDQALFLWSRPSRRSALWLVESPARTPQRRCSSAWSSASVMSGVAVTSLRRLASWGARSGRRRPPYRAGAALPVARTRCISLIAADGLTAKRWAAARIELPRSTARTIRRRRSMEIGAGMVTSRLVSTVIVKSQAPIPRNRNAPQTLSGST